MGEIRFYHTLEGKLQLAVPSLLQKIYGTEQRCLLICNDAAQVKEMDDYLWEYTPESFLPHGVEGEGNEERQPILLSTEAGDKAFPVAMVFDADKVAALKGCDLICYMFDAGDKQNLGKARQLWKVLKDSGETLAYWQQQENGSWNKKDV